MRNFYGASVGLIFVLLKIVYAAADCGVARSCTACRSNDGCHWCSGKWTSTFPMLKGTTLYGPGVCVSKQKKCGDVQFGSLASILEVEQLSASLKIVEIHSSREQCNSLDWPQELAIPTCEECVSQDGRGWCSAGADFSLLFFSLSSAGGVCIPQTLSFLCDPSVQVIPGLKLKANYLQSPEQCASGTAHPATVSSPTCAKNLSCRKCSESPGPCTWCGVTGKFEVPILGNVPFSLAGMCLEGENRDCAGVSLSLSALTSNLGTAAHSEVVKKVIALAGISPISPLDASNATCSSVEWPTNLVSYMKTDAKAKHANSKAERAEEL